MGQRWPAGEPRAWNSLQNRLRPSYHEEVGVIY